MDALFHLSDEIFLKVTEGVIKTLHKSEGFSVGGIEKNVIESIKEAIRKFIISNNFNLGEVTEQLRNNDWEEQKVNSLIKIIEENKAYLLYSMLLRHNGSFGDTIIDYNWVMKLVLGTSDLKVLRYPLLQIEISTVNSSGEQIQRPYDLSRESLSKLITAIENGLEIN